MYALFRPLLISFAIAVGVVGALLLFARPWQQGDRAAELTYFEFKSLVEHGDVVTAVLEDGEANGYLRTTVPLAETGKQTTLYRTQLPPMGDPELLPLMEDKGVELRIVGGRSIDWTGAVETMLFWGPLIFLVWLLLRMRPAGGVTQGGLVGQGGVDGFLGKVSEQAGQPDQRVTFADVAGQEAAKREVAELVEYLRNPDRYTRLGAQVPRGILLVGQPGTGKTMLARALAGEAEVPFFYASASQFMEIFVGVGASRVRKLFDAAKKKAPCIIFIDELDSVGRARGAGMVSGNDEREQTLNQILSEMDGFMPNEAIIILGATNRPDVLDPALLRPGRFDRHVTLDMPDRAARLAILQVHVRAVPLAGDVDLDQMARGTPGFSGADLKNLINEAAMAAARENSQNVTRRHLEGVRDRLMLGSERSLAMLEDERHRLAVHEAGHTAVAHFLPGADPIFKVTIVPRGRALGVTQQMPEIERHAMPEDYLRVRLAILMGGRAAERVFLGSLSSGADEDIRVATQIARAMVNRWGMAEDIGPMDIRESEEHPFLGRSMAQPRSCSEATVQAADRAVRAVLTDAERRAMDVLRTRRREVECLIGELERRETLDRATIDACLEVRDVAA